MGFPTYDQQMELYNKRQLVSYTPGQLVPQESGSTIGNTKIVYDIYDVDPTPAFPIEHWYPVAFFYRSAE